MVPGDADAATYWEHAERYRFATRFAFGKDVADIACGEGYGAAALAEAGATSLVAIDSAAAAVSHARETYGIDARMGNAEAIPLKDDSVDLIVSFETIEHLVHPDQFLDECQRTLRHDGQLVISTPNADIYRQTSPNNPYHVSEMRSDEFHRRLLTRFRSVQSFGQCRPSPRWTRLRGGTRLFDLGTRLFNPLRTVQTQAISRKSTLEYCLARTTAPGRYFTPESVQSVAGAELEHCKYLIAVASQY